MRRAPLWLAVLVALAVSTAQAFADTPATGTTTTAVVTPAGTAAVAAPVVTYAPLGMGFTVLGIGLGLGLIGYAALSGMARQPEQAGNIRTTMLIIGGLVEGAGIISLILCLVAKN